MTNFTAADVKKLREHTAAGMMDCKNALTEADGDFDKAVEILRIKGAKRVGKRAGRTASNGLISVVLDGHGSGVLLEVNCETDFVAKTEGLQRLAADIAAFVARTRPADVETLLAADYDAKRTVKTLLDEANSSMGEKVEVGRFERVEGAYVGSYLHRTSPDLPPQIGVLVALDAEHPQVAKEIAQHIAAAQPQYLARDEVPTQVVENERRIAEATAREEGKPDQALPKIVEGRVNAFFKDTVLLDQGYVREPRKSVKAVLDESEVGVTRFARFKVGAY
ncbi:MAG: translation elongation factor Ts [Carbonactinosporaceae bacterium]